MQGFKNFRGGGGLRTLKTWIFGGDVSKHHLCIHGWAELLGGGWGSVHPRAHACCERTIKSQYDERDLLKI